MLPLELLAIIAGYLPCSDLKSLAQTSPTTRDRLQAAGVFRNRLSCCTGCVDCCCFLFQTANKKKMSDKTDEKPGPSKDRSRDDKSKEDKSKKSGRDNPPSTKPPTPQTLPNILEQVKK